MLQSYKKVEDFVMIQFGTGGFRGVIADDFTKANIQTIAQGIANIYKERKYMKPIIVGYDFRFCSKEASIWIAEVLAGNDIPVLLSDEPSPTPTIMEESKRMDNEFGIMITASHNPYWFNGVKLFQNEGMDAEKSLTDELEKKISLVDQINTLPIQQALKEKKVIYIYPLKPYLENILKFVSIDKTCKKNTKILIDPIYGTGLLTLEPTLRAMGFSDIKVIHNEHNPLFGGLLPNPVEKNMLSDKDIVLNEHYDICIGTDSDCDRLAILDEKGNYVDANEILASIYYYLVKYRNEKGDIVKNLATSNLVDSVAVKCGYKCHEVDVGFKNISAGIKEYDALLGGESSGGLTMRGYIYGKDSTFATALFLEMVSEMKKPVSEIIKEVRDFASFNKVSYEDSITFKNKDKIKEACRKEMPLFTEGNAKVKEVTNNFKYYFPSGDWALIRFSGTEPLIRIFVESDKNKEDCLKDIAAIKEFVIKHDQD